MCFITYIINYLLHINWNGSWNLYCCERWLVLNTKRVLSECTRALAVATWAPSVFKVCTVYFQLWNMPVYYLYILIHSYLNYAFKYFNIFSLKPLCGLISFAKELTLTVFCIFRFRKTSCSWIYCNVSLLLILYVPTWASDRINGSSLHVWASMYKMFSYQERPGKNNLEKVENSSRK